MYLFNVFNESAQHNCVNTTLSWLGTNYFSIFNDHFYSLKISVFFLHPMAEYLCNNGIP